MPPPYRALNLGPLPADLINRILDTELEPGEVWISKAAHGHIATDHAADYPIIWPMLPECIAAPFYVGQDIKHANNFVLINRIAGPDAAGVIVAIGLEPNPFGGYNLRSSYRIKEVDIQSRLAKGHLHRTLGR